MTNMPATDGDVVEVAHESLNRPWPTLYTWPETHRTHLLLRESVREAAPEWGHHACDERYLARWGGPREAAEALRYQTRVGLNAQEHAYLAAAIALRHERGSRSVRPNCNENKRHSTWLQEPRLLAMRSSRQGERPSCG